jgi:hypothetical protein
LQQAGVENLSISRGGNGNISTQFCVLCWIKNVDTFAFVNGAVNLNDSARVEIVGSFLHDCYDCENNGVEYALSLNAGTTENLIDNNIITNSGKGMVGRASGGGNVISYNYCDDTFYMASGGIGNFFVDHCLNMSHFKGSHHALFEGNYGNTGGDDNTHGNVVYNVYYRNNLTGLRAPFNDPSLATSTSVTFNAADAPENDQTGVCFATGHAYPYTSCGPLRAASVMLWAYWHAFSGNVLGKSGVTTAGNGWVNNGLYGGTQFGANWILGWNNLLTGTDPNLDGTNTPRWVWQDGNFDYLSGSVTWTAGAHSLPNSLYLSAAPAFFGPGASATYTWPQVTPTGSPQIQTNSLSGSGLPAKARYDAGTPFSQPHHDELTEPANDNDPAQDIARALNAA